MNLHSLRNCLVGKSSSKLKRVQDRTQKEQTRFSKLFLPKPRSDSFLRSQSVEEPSHSNPENVLEEERSFSESELNRSRSFQTEMDIKRSPKRQYSYHCVSWNELSESQKGENVEMVVNNRAKRSRSEKPRMVKGMSIEHLDKVIIRRANSAYIERQRRKSQSSRRCYSFHGKGSSRKAYNIHNKDMQKSHVLKRSVSDPCIKVSLLETKLENLNLLTKSKKHRGLIKAKGHVCFMISPDPSLKPQHQTKDDDSSVRNEPQGSFVTHDNKKVPNHMQHPQKTYATLTSVSKTDESCATRLIQNVNHVPKHKQEHKCEFLGDSKIIGSHSYPELRKEQSNVDFAGTSKDFYSTGHLDNHSTADFIHCKNGEKCDESSHCRILFSDPFYREQYRKSLTEPIVDEDGVRETFI